MRLSCSILCVLLASVLVPSAKAALPYPAALLPQERSVTAYDKAVEDDIAAGLTPAGRLTASINSPAAFDFGAISGDATMEFILDGNPNVGTGSAYLAVGTNAGSNLRYEQFNNTGQLGFTQLGVGDYGFIPNVSSPTTPKVVTYVWDSTARVMSLYLDGELAGTRSGIPASFSMPSGPGWLMRNPGGGELMTGTIYRVTTYDFRLGPDVIQRHVQAYINHGQRLPVGGGPVAIDGDYAAVSVYPGTEIYHREDYGWRRLGNLDWPAESLAMEGDTLVMGETSSGIPPSRFRALVYVRGDEPGLNAWHLRDGDNGLPPTSYQVDVPADLDESARTNGWRYRLVSRFVDDYRGGVCMMFLYGDGARRHLVYFDLDDNGDLAVELIGSTPQRRVLTSGGTGTVDYHTHEIVFNPTNQLATYLFDGTAIHSWAGDAASNNGIFWGSGSTAARGAMNVQQARFEILQGGPVVASYNAGTEGNPVVAPDPVSLGWSMLNPNNSSESARRPLAPDLETVWRRQGDLRASDGAPGIGNPNDGFGSSLDLSGDTIVVGAPYDDISNTADTGAAYVFVRNGTTWTEQQKLVPSVRSVNDYFGWSVAIDGNSIIAGAPNRYFGTQTNPGRAFVFTRSGTTWTQQGGPLAASDGAAREAFGYALDIEGDRAAISAAADTHSGRNFAGSVYIFERTGAAWSQQAKMIANPVGSGFFGSSLALHGDAIVIAEEESNRHFVFTRNGAGAWAQRQIHNYSDQTRLRDVDFDGTRLIVSVGVIEDLGENACYIFEPDYSQGGLLAGYARGSLYYPDAKSPQSFADPNQAAFRYKHLLYGAANGQLQPRYPEMASLYGPAERALAAAVESELLKGLSATPTDPGLGNLLLDLYYDRTVAETILARETLTAADRARFGSSIEGAIAPPAPAGGFIIDNEIPLQRRMVATNKVAMQGYFDLLKMELTVEERHPATLRWATRVLGFSSEYSPSPGNWSAAQVLGAPDTYPNYGDLYTAWASQSPDDEREYLELGFDNPAPIDRVTVYETWNPGAVNKISVLNPLTGQWEEVWSGLAVAAGDAARSLTFLFPMTPFPVDTIRIDIDSPAVAGWNEIDAVGLPGAAYRTFSTDATFGHRLFQMLVPGRGLAPATYTNAVGQDVVVTTNSLVLTNGLLFTGYKDLVLLFDLLRDHGRSAASLSRLLAGRRNAGDLDEAKAVAGDAQQFLFLHGSLLKNMFAELPPASDPSGLAQAIDGWAQALYSLAELQQALATDANPLGFAPDFLMLAENFFGVETHFDSFDSFAERLSLDSSSSPLRRAHNALDDARTAYGQFRGFEDQIAAQFDDSTTAYEFRLFEIVGAFPWDELNYTDDPTANPGSELDQQYRSIEVARLRILKNKTEISNLNKEVQIEQQRAADVSRIIIKYGNKQAKLTEEIGDINAAQAGANQLTDYFNPANLVSGASIAIALNFGVQTISEIEKAKLEARKERLAALEQSEIVGAESAARVKTLLLRMNTLVLDSQEASLLLNQEMARMTALYREKGELEKRLAEARTELASRYFADPLHRVTSQSTMIDANLAFDEAQKWMFFMARALEYKINSAFTNNFLGRAWNSHSVFKARNADELVDLYDAMIDYNDLASRSRQPETSWFSIREDHLGYRTGVDAQGQPLRYLDPDTGDLVPAIEAFRRYLKRNVRELAGNSAEIVLEFSTAKDLFATAGENFFRGPSFNLNGTIADRGAYLDKIDGLHLRLPGSHSVGNVSVPGRLSYGGTSFIRNPRVGTYDPIRTDRLRNELTAYSTRYWFRDQDLVWRFAEAFSSQVTLTLSTAPRQETTSDQIVVFKERSVAATGWVLAIRIRSGGNVLLNIDELTDVELFFRHSSISRLQ